MSERIGVRWASLGPGVRVSGSSTESPAVATGGSVTVTREVVHGQMGLVLRDSALVGHDIFIPWHNVGSCEYAEPEHHAPAVKKTRAAEAAT